MASIKVPPLGESIVEATVSRWLRAEGATVAVGDPLVELETDKITVEVPALEAGVLTARTKREGDVVAVGEILGELTAGAPAGATAPAAVSTAAVSTAAPPEPPASAPAPARVSPAAARLAAETGVDLTTVQGTGRGGVVSKADIVATAAVGGTATAVGATATTAGGTATTVGATATTAGATATTAGATAPTVVASAPPVVGSSPPVVSSLPLRETRERMSTRRRRIAANLLQSQQATAHLTTFNEIDMSAITQLRDRLRERVEKEQGVKLSFMPFFAKAACLALQAYPVVNAQIDGDDIVHKHYVNLGIAVASDAGLVVPNIKDADRKSIVEIGRDLSALAKRARDGKLTMDDLTGGTFTITNGGVFGSLLSTPIINYPQVGILGLHKIQDRPVAVHGRVEIRPMMYTALSYDHRLIDGQQAVLFLVRLKELMEDPAAMLVA